LVKTHGANDMGENTDRPAASEAIVKPRYTATYFRDIVVTPFSELLDGPKGLSQHRGGPVWPEWEQQTVVRHCRNRRPIDKKPEELPADTRLDEVREPLAWCGPIVAHFGHQVADFSTRIPVYQSFLDRDFYYCFAVHPRSKVREIKEAPQFFQDMLEWYDVPRSRVRIIHSPVIARELVCISQQEQLAQVGPWEVYLDLLDKNFYIKRIKQPRKCTYYISRAGMQARFAGEGYIEYALGQSGAKVLRPETISLQEQLRIYAGASVLLFAEGSALHGMQLLGRNMNQVHVLNRRPGVNLASRLLRPRCTNLRYYDVASLVPGLWMSGQPATPHGLSILDKEAFFAATNSAGIALRDWSDEAFRCCVELDVKSWYRRIASSPGAKVPGSLSQIDRKLADFGLKGAVTCHFPRREEEQQEFFR